MDSEGTASSPCYEPDNAKNVFYHLTERIWTERARAACLLRNIKTAQYKDQVDKEKFLETLVFLMKEENEKSLFVSKMALDTYSELTGFQLSGVFDFDGAINDWKNLDRKKEILKANF